MKLLLALVAALSLSACSLPAKVIHDVQVGEIRLVLTDAQCTVKEVVAEVNAAGVKDLKAEGIFGGRAESKVEKRNLCWKEIMPGIALVQDEKGDGGMVPLGK